jgi:Alpha/beta hydrolase domain
MRWLIVFALSAASSASVLAASDPATVTGPIPAMAAPGDPSHNYPFFSTRPWLDRYDYEEEEFYVEGLANEYAITPNQTATIATGGPYPYKTRVIVRRPKSADKFNGTVILEWINVTPMHDFEIDWSWSHEHLMRRGFVHIGASVQTNGIDSPNGLKQWNPTRYGSLNVTADGKFKNDQLSFSIYSQIVRAIKDPSRERLVGNLKVKNVVATGHSQSAGRLTVYYNSIHPLEGVVDGFVLHGGVQSGPVRTDLRTPAWKLLAETDVLRGQAAVRQPDSEYFRTWEVAGTSHGDLDLSSFFDPLRARDVASSAPGACERPILSRVPAYLVQNAVYDHMKRWIENGTQPPSAPRITMSSIGKVGTPADRYSVVARDENGNALGGIRLAQVAVPTATNTGLNEGPGFCRIYGSHERFDAAKIARLYPTRTKYITEVNRITDENLAAGYITEEGAAQTKREAADRREH